MLIREIRRDFERVPGRYPLIVAIMAGALFAQEPNVHLGGPPPGKAATDDSITAAALAGSKQDPAAVERGGKAFRTNCAGCHGVAAKGGPGAPDLVRSLLVLDDEKGILIAPVIREGRPDKGMPKLNLTEQQISDIVAWLHVRTYAAGHRTTYAFGNVVTGNAAQGKAYFEGAGRCSTCHSPSGDLAGIGKKYDPISLQGRWLQPRGGRREARSSGGHDQAAKNVQPTATVTLANGQSFTGTLDRIDDFTVSLRDEKGQYHSFSRENGEPKIVIHDPLQAHNELLHHYTDADIHNVTAYLASLK